MTGIIIFIFLFIAGVAVSMIIDQNLVLKKRCRFQEGLERDYQLELNRKSELIRIMREAHKEETGRLEHELENAKNENVRLDKLNCLLKDDYRKLENASKKLFEVAQTQEAGK